MNHSMSPWTIAVLRMVHTAGPLSIAKINNLASTHPMLPEGGSKNAITSLLSQRYIDGIPDHDTPRALAYVATNKGRRLLRSIDQPVPRGSVARSRMPQKFEKVELYDGADLRPFIGRAGALEAFTLPSLRNGVRVERRAPILMASTSDKRRPQ